MKSSKISRVVLLIAVAALALSAMALPAFATTDRGLVPNNPTVGGVDLGGMTEAAARQAIIDNTSVPALPAITVSVNGGTRTFDPATAVTVNVDGMLDRVYDPAATGTYVLATSYKVSTFVIANWTAGIAGGINRAPVNATRFMSGPNFGINPSVVGLVTDQATPVNLIRRRIVELLGGSGSNPAIAMSIASVQPAITPETLGKTIVVNLSQRRVYLFNGPWLERSYPCAIGQRSFPTPTGDFTIVNKVMFPSWTNPGSRWAARMPSSIRPGANNPLGTRALYLNASGIRIHGTNNNGSIGTAASHGCMRLRRADIEALYPLVPIGTPVFIRR
jgi:lipoprotein-anchoring transpeptidase ErfK/SrfK